MSARPLLRPLLEQARADVGASGRWQALADAVPYARWLGLRAEVGEDEVVCRVPFQPMIVGNASLPALHGGAIGGLLECAAAFQIMYAAPDVVVPRIINLTVDYLRSARPAETFAAGLVVKHGRRVTSVRAVAWQEDRARPIASAHGHFLMDDGA